jgi:DNA-binding GntR family transcriptional regulator
MRERRGPSLTIDVYDQLRVAVLHGELTSGQRLHLSNLAKEYGVSLGVMREAVTRLASERLLEATPQAGFRVRPISTEHLAHLTEVRCHLERLAVTEAILNGDVHWEGDLVAAHHVLSITPPVVGDTLNPEWMSAHRKFHTALAAGCPNPILLDLRQQLFDEAELYRHRSAERGGRKRNIGREHKALLEAALARDVDTASTLIESHLRTTAELSAANLQHLDGAAPSPTPSNPEQQR